MYFLNTNLFAASAVALALCGPARADQVFNGVTYAQLKSVVTHMGVETQERTTNQGNKYILVHVPNSNITFASTTASCPNGQNIACLGFANFVVLDGSLSDTNRFNQSNQFLKAYPASSAANTIFTLESFAIGGVTDLNVASAAGYFANFVKAMTSKTSSAEPAKPTAPSFTSLAKAQAFFADLAKQSLSTTGKAPAPNAESMGAFADYLNGAKAK